MPNPPTSVITLLRSAMNSRRVADTCTNMILAYMLPALCADNSPPSFKYPYTHKWVQPYMARLRQSPPMWRDFRLDDMAAIVVFPGSSTKFMCLGRSYTHDPRGGEFGLHLMNLDAAPSAVQPVIPMVFGDEGRYAYIVTADHRTIVVAGRRQRDDPPRSETRIAVWSRLRGEWRNDSKSDYVRETPALDDFGRLPKLEPPSLMLLHLVVDVLVSEPESTVRVVPAVRFAILSGGDGGCKISMGEENAFTCKKVLLDNFQLLFFTRREWGCWKGRYMDVFIKIPNNEDPTEGKFVQTDNVCVDTDPGPSDLTVTPLTATLNDTPSAFVITDSETGFVWYDKEEENGEYEWVCGTVIGEPGCSVSAVASLSDGLLVCILTKDDGERCNKILQVWDWTKGVLVSQLEYSGYDPSNCIYVLPDGRVLVCTSLETYTVYAWNQTAQTLGELGTLTDGEIKATLPDGRLLVVAVVSGVLEVWG